MRRCLYGYSQNTTGPSYCQNSKLCNYSAKMSGCAEELEFNLYTQYLHSDGRIQDHFEMSVCAKELIQSITNTSITMEEYKIIMLPKKISRCKCVLKS